MAENKYIGGLWLNTAKSGMRFMKGSIDINGERIKIVVFKNKHKQARNHPDYTIILDQPREQRQETTDEREPRSDDDFDEGPKEEEVPF